MPRTLNDKEILAFLADAPRTGHVATVREDGRPHVATIWFTVDGNDIVFVTSSASVKARNLNRMAFAVLSVDDGRPPFSNVSVEGPVAVVNDMEQVRTWTRIIAERYMGPEWAQTFSEMDDLPDDMVCRLTPSHSTGLANMAEA